MKYCIKFYQNCRALDYADEIMIKYFEANENLKTFAETIEDEVRLIVNITELSDADAEASLRYFRDASNVHKNFAIMLSKDQNILPDISEMNIPYFFIEGANTLNDVAALVNLGVSDVYVQNELGFRLGEAAALCHKSDTYVNVRVFPNVAQSSSVIDTDTFTYFYIRPDDVVFYEEYVDVFEFFGPIDRQSVLFDIYTSERWLGNLEDVIIGLKTEIDNKTIVPIFGECRVKCKQLCKQGKCRVCDKIKEVGRTLAEKKIGLYKRKKEYEHRTNKEVVSNESGEVDERPSALSTD